MRPLFRAYVPLLPDGDGGDSAERCVGDVDGRHDVVEVVAATPRDHRAVLQRGPCGTDRRRWRRHPRAATGTFTVQYCEKPHTMTLPFFNATL